MRCVGGCSFQTESYDAEFIFRDRVARYKGLYRFCKGCDREVIPKDLILHNEVQAKKARRRIVFWDNFYTAMSWPIALVLGSALAVVVIIATLTIAGY